MTGSTFALRPFRPDDFDAARSLGAAGGADQWVPDLPAPDGRGVVAYYEDCRSRGEMLHLVIADLSGDAYLGEVMLVVGEHRVGELGCGVDPAARGRGVATEALRLLADWSLGRLGLGRVQVLVVEENAPALRLVERAGFRREGVLRAYWEHGGVRFDTVVFSLLPDDQPRRSLQVQ